MNTDELRAAYEALPPLPPAVTTWDRHQHTLRERVANDYPGRFLRWRPITGTIAMRRDGYIEDEYQELMEDARDWSDVVIEPEFGGNRHVGEDGTSGVMIHQAYHFKQWLDKTGVDAADLDSVFEVGAGYGAMALVLELLGFRGDYYILDLPEMALLCQYYLANVGAQTRPVFEVPERADLVIAMHSWNEMPIDQRGPIEAVDADGYLIAYKDEYSGIDNKGYFERIVQARQHLTWHKWQPEYRKGGRWYLVGVK